MSSIKPTIGRKVWYWSYQHQVLNNTQPFDATIIFVHSNDCVNLLVTTHVGDVCMISTVLLRDPQDTDTHESAGGTATWMPYQVNQAVASPAAS